jgi:hypothetical protein
MAESDPEKSQNGSSTPSGPSDLNEAEENLARCLEAYDQAGDAGLEKALDPIYPPTGPRGKTRLDTGLISGSVDYDHPAPTRRLDSSPKGKRLNREPKAPPEKPGS